MELADAIFLVITTKTDRLQGFNAHSHLAMLICTFVTGGLYTYSVDHLAVEKKSAQCRTSFFLATLTTTSI
jgi:hypothetical protein